MQLKQLLVHSEKDRRNILAKFGKDVEGVEVDVRNIKKWMKSEEGVPDDVSDHKIEVFLVTNKFNEEKTKTKLKKYFTVRLDEPEIFGRIFSLDRGLQNVFTKLTFLPLPKLHKDHRIFVHQFRDSSLAAFDQKAFAAMIFQVLDVVAEESYAEGVIALLDFSGFTFWHATKANIGVLMKIYQLMVDVYSGRMKEIHVINTSPLVASIITLVKTFVRAKFISRITYHKNLKSLHQAIPKNKLPEDFGGLEMSMERLLDAWKPILIEKEEYFKSLNGLNKIGDVK